MSEQATGLATREFQFETASAVETSAVGAKLLELLEPPVLLVLTGTLGAGKTTLVKGLAEAMQAANPDEVTSPTFTLIHEYDGERNGKPVLLYHLDLYRLENERQVENLGIDELLEEDAIVLVEWGEKFPSVVRMAAGELRIESTGGDSRSIGLKLRNGNPTGSSV